MCACVSVFDVYGLLIYKKREKELVWYSFFYLILGTFTDRLQKLSALIKN